MIIWSNLLLPTAIEICQEIRLKAWDDYQPPDEDGQTIYIDKLIESSEMFEKVAAPGLLQWIWENYDYNADYNYGSGSWLIEYKQPPDDENPFYLPGMYRKVTTFAITRQPYFEPPDHLWGFVNVSDGQAWLDFGHHKSYKINDDVPPNYWRQEYANLSLFELTPAGSIVNQIGTGLLGSIAIGLFPGVRQVT